MHPEIEIFEAAAATACFLNRCTMLLLMWPCVHCALVPKPFVNARRCNFYGGGRTTARTNSLSLCASHAVELQKDCGRGLEHLSARLQEGTDLMVYQIGTWHVDHTEVGSGAPPRLLLARVDILQLNFAGDHEHGRIIGTAISAVDGSALTVNEDEEYGGVECGPEQLIARIPAQWESDYCGELLAQIPATLPASLAGDDGTLLPVELGRHEGPGLG